MNKTAIIAIAVVAVVAVAGAGVAIVLMNQDKTPTATFLIEDQNSVYFWAEGKGNTAADALTKMSPGVTATLVDSSFGKYLSAVNGLSEDYTTDSCYWGVYYYKDNKWTMSDVGLSSLNVSDYPTIGLFYLVCDATTYEVKAGGPDNVTVPSIEDKKVWGGSQAGTIFAIKGESGLYFYTNSNASGTMADRFLAMTEEYKIPFTASKTGISKLFNIGSKQISVDPNVWAYWAQFGLIDGAWGYMSTTMPNTENPDDYKQFAVVYGDGGMGSTSTPLPPIYKA